MKIRRQEPALALAVVVLLTLPCLQRPGAARNREEAVVKGYQIEKAMVAVDQTGRPHIASDQGLNGRRIFYSYCSGSEWKTVELYPNGRPAGVTAEPRIALGSGDTAWIGFHAASRENHRRATVSFLRIDRLSSSPAIGPLTQTVQGTRTNLKTDAHGGIYVLWRMGTDLFYQVYDPEGKNPSAIRRLTNVKVTIPDDEMGMCSNSFDFDLGSDGVVHGVCTNILGLVYSNSEMEAQDKGVLMVARGHRVGCEGPYTVPVIQVDRAAPRVVYVLFAGVANKAYLIVKTESGWQSPMLLAAEGWKQAGRRAPPFLAAAPGGGAIAAWMDARSGQPKIRSRWILKDGRLGPEMEVASGCHPRFAIDAGGLLHFVYTRGGDLYYQVTEAPPRPSERAPATQVSRP